MVVSRAAIPTKIEFFRYPGDYHFSSFSNILLYRFWLHFGCQLGAKIGLKSIESRSQEWSGKPATFSITRSSNFAGFGTPQNLESRVPSRREANFWDFGLHFLYRCFMHFRLHFWRDFGTIFDLKSFQHGLKNIKKNLDFGSHFYKFLVDFGLHLGTHFPLKSLKIRRPS